jgi:hypothetical protein
MRLVVMLLLLLLSCSAVTRCAGPFGANKKQVDMGQVGKTGAAVFMQDAINKAGATYWGGDAGTVCNTVLLKPIMTCGDGCISDNRCGRQRHSSSSSRDSSRSGSCSSNGGS